MTQTTLGALLGTIGEDTDLLTLALLEDVRYDLGSLDVRSAGLQAVFSADGDDLVKGDGGFHLSVELFHVDHVAVLYLVLLSAGLDNRVHFIGTCLFLRLATLGRERHLSA